MRTFLTIFLLLSGCKSVPIAPVNEAYVVNDTTDTINITIVETDFDVWIDTEVLHISPEGWMIFKSSEGVPTGTLDWTDDKFKFHGDIEASAQQFFDTIEYIYNQAYGKQRGRLDGWRGRLSPPTLTELPQDTQKIFGEEPPVQVNFIETRLTAVGDEGQEDFDFSIWMPDVELQGNWVLVSKPGIITGNTVMLVDDLLQSL